ncbi:MAG: hypothetical protein KatS3mg125_0654 [Lysobacterales bacterium]|jgi:putative flippase GtrA|nr:MAG: hypothetical protein KatS3mg125_0654 [Xanthomonadales bacterium]
MALIAQGLRFLLVGALLIAVDTLLFIGLTALTIDARLANLVSRLCGAALGFLLHGGFTFADEQDPPLWSRAFLRYAILWLGLTAFGALTLGAIAHAMGLRAAWAAKAPLEALLAVASFLLMRRWVFRR